MNKETERILTQDTVYESEKILCKDNWSEFNEMDNAFCLFKAMSDNHRKTEHLKGLGDTYWGVDWNEFKNLIKSYGFIPALEYDFKYDSFGESCTEECIIYYHPEKGMVIHATSFGNKDHINGGNLYAEIEANSDEDEEVICKWLSTGGCIEGLIYETQQDIREGLFSKLNELETAGKFLNRWTNKNRFLWFVDYSEEKKNGYDYRVITQNKIKRCPQEFRDIIGR